MKKKNILCGLFIFLKVVLDGFRSFFVLGKSQCGYQLIFMAFWDLRIDNVMAILICSILIIFIKLNFPSIKYYLDFCRACCSSKDSSSCLIAVVFEPVSLVSFFTFAQTGGF